MRVHAFLTLTSEPPYSRLRYLPHDGVTVLVSGSVVCGNDQPIGEYAVARSIASFVVLALLVTGCSKAVQITQPASSPLTAPLTIFEVKFAPQFLPGSFNAQLDGADVTAGFVPTAAPAGTSKMHLPDTPEGLTGGTMVNGGSPPPRGFGGSTLPPGVQFGAGTGGPSTPPGGPSGGGSGKPTPNIALYTHQLHVSGQCNGLICATTDDLVFFPIHLAGNPTTLNLRIGQKAQATVETFPAISTPLVVRVRPFNVAVSLDGLAPGASIMRTIPPGGSSAPFTITGLVSANLILIIEAAGTQMGSIQGVVDPQ